MLDRTIHSPQRHILESRTLETINRPVRVVPPDDEDRDHDYLLVDDHGKEIGVIFCPKVADYLKHLINWDKNSKKKS